MGLEHEGIYIGNKIVLGERNGESYFDVSLNKEIFVKKGKNFVSLSDFSNMQKLWRIDRDSNALHEDDIIVPHQEFKLFTEPEYGVHYVVLLKAAWKYLGGGASLEEVKNFVIKYNKKLLPVVEKHITAGELQIRDWWYCGDEYMEKEDLVEIVSTTEDNLIRTLAAVDGSSVDYKRLAKQVKRR